MDIRAIILTVAPEDCSTSVTGSCPEVFAGTRIGLLPVLGRPVLHHLVDSLRASEICSVSVLHVGESSSSWVQDARSADLHWKDVPEEQIWRAAEEQFESLVQAGADLVLLIRLGAYTELELDSLVQFHFDQRNHVTSVVAPDGPLDVFVLSSSRRNDAAFLLRNKLARTRVPSVPFVTSGYVNRLRTPIDLRRLTVDSFMQRTRIQPAGKQLRPGIWVGAGARIARNVRLVAPCYVGAASKVKAGALITRGSSIEHHCTVERGTVLEASSVLPLSCIGTGLDVTHSVVGAKRIFSVKFAAEVEVEDPTLVSVLPSTSVVRTLSHAAGLLSFVPRQIVKGFLKQPKLRQPQTDAGCSPESPAFDAASLAHPIAREGTLSSRVAAGVRDYGNQ